MNSQVSVKADMPVICSQGGQFAVVDHMQGDDMVKLKKDDKGVHHLMPLSWVTSTEGGQVKIDRSGDEAIAQWSEMPKS